MKRIFILICAVFLSSCAQNNVWVKPGAAQGEFAQAKYSCMQQSQQRISGAYVNQYGGSSSSEVITNNALWSACMNASGWTLQSKDSLDRLQAEAHRQTQINTAKNQINAMNEAIARLCLREDLQPYYRKTPCRPEDTTLAQMSDKSHITPPEKAALSKVRAEITGLYARNSQFYPPSVPTITKHLIDEGDKLALEFYEGRLSRGEYNQRRRDIAQQAKNDEMQIAKSN
jgi:hypothetical protein